MLRHGGSTKNDTACGSLLLWIRPEADPLLNSQARMIREPRDGLFVAVDLGVPSMVVDGGILDLGGKGIYGTVKAVHAIPDCCDLGAQLVAYLVEPSVDEAVKLGELVID
ncbi:hypothetical protein MXD62_16880 [Frankia sp. Mgl5]|uniref:hypothetical protein n=1 Tax=Frankia sp. Mgl5 TaxID=2933793 RepID=UPI00200F1AC1|nr:hypothetical protein [Frankia sp. Mgl5]MCK9928832.1 hypothetical protein [Frankia sp. Mgl5]